VLVAAHVRIAVVEVTDGLDSDSHHSRALERCAHHHAYRLELPATRRIHTRRRRTGFRPSRLVRPVERHLHEHIDGGVDKRRNDDGTRRHRACEHLADEQQEVHLDGCHDDAVVVLRLLMGMAADAARRGLKHLNRDVL